MSKNLLSAALQGLAIASVPIIALGIVALAFGMPEVKDGPWRAFMWLASMLSLGLGMVHYAALMTAACGSDY